MTEEYPKINAEDQVEKKDSIYTFYKDMIAFRQASEYSNCLIFGDIKPVKSGENVIAYCRYTDEEEILCYFNFDVNSTEEQINGNEMEVIWGNMEQTELKEDSLILKPFQSVLLKKKVRG